MCFLIYSYCLFSFFLVLVAHNILVAYFEHLNIFFINKQFSFNFKHHIYKQSSSIFNKWPFALIFPQFFSFVFFSIFSTQSFSENTSTTTFLILFTILSLAYSTTFLFLFLTFDFCPSHILDPSPVSFCCLYILLSPYLSSTTQSPFSLQSWQPVLFLSLLDISSQLSQPYNIFKLLPQFRCLSQPVSISLSSITLTSFHLLSKHSG